MNMAGAGIQDTFELVQFERSDFKSKLKFLFVQNTKPVRTYEMYCIIASF